MLCIQHDTILDRAEQHPKDGGTLESLKPWTRTGSRERSVGKACGALEEEKAPFAPTFAFSASNILCLGQSLSQLRHILLLHLNSYSSTLRPSGLFSRSTKYLIHFRVWL